MKASRRYRFSTAAIIGAYSAGAVIAQDARVTLVLAAPVVLAPLGLWLLSGAGQWIAAFLTSALLLPPLPVAGGNAGPHPSAVFAAAGLGIGLLRFREWRIARDPVAFWLLLFITTLLASVVSAVFYSGFDVAGGSLARVLLFGISVYLYIYVASGPGVRTTPVLLSAITRWLFVVAIAAAAFACADFYFQWPAPAGYGPQFVWLDTGIYRRAQGLFYEASTLGNFCCFFLLGIAASVIQKSAYRLASVPVLLAAAALFATALVLSYSRASVLNLAAGTAVLVYLRRRRIPLKTLLLSLSAAIAVAGVAAYVIFPSFAHMYGLRLLISFQRFFSDTNRILSGRLENWTALKGLFAEHPWALLLGVGYKTLPYSDVAGRPLVVDNMYLSLLAETGIVGLLIFAGLNYAILRSAYIAARSGSSSASFFGTWILAFWVGELVQMFSGDLLTYWRVLPVYFWVLACSTHGGTQS